jgi:hypothetical protein
MPAREDRREDARETDDLPRGDTWPEDIGAELRRRAAQQAPTERPEAGKAAVRKG